MRATSYLQWCWRLVAWWGKGDEGLSQQQRAGRLQASAPGKLLHSESASAHGFCLLEIFSRPHQGWVQAQVSPGHLRNFAASAGPFCMCSRFATSWGLHATWILHGHCMRLNEGVAKHASSMPKCIAGCFRAQQHACWAALHTFKMPYHSYMIERTMN